MIPDLYRATATATKKGEFAGTADGYGTSPAGAAGNAKTQLRLNLGIFSKAKFAAAHEVTVEEPTAPLSEEELLEVPEAILKTFGILDAVLAETRAAATVAERWLDAKTSVHKSGSTAASAISEPEPTPAPEPDLVPAAIRALPEPSATTERPYLRVQFDFIHHKALCFDHRLVLGYGNTAEDAIDNAIARLLARKPELTTTDLHEEFTMKNLTMQRLSREDVISLGQEVMGIFGITDDDLTI